VYTGQTPSRGKFRYHLSWIVRDVQNQSNRMGFQPGLQDFSWYKTPKLGKIYQIATKYNKWPLYTYNKILHCKTLQNVPKFRFWSENKPSGNPGFNCYSVPEIFTSENIYVMDYTHAYLMCSM
jgi:hypothetical protein